MFVKEMELSRTKSFIATLKLKSTTIESCLSTYFFNESITNCAWQYPCNRNNIKEKTPFENFSTILPRAFKGLELFQDLDAFRGIRVSTEDNVHLGHQALQQAVIIFLVGVDDVQLGHVITLDA